MQSAESRSTGYTDVYDLRAISQENARLQRHAALASSRQTARPASAATMPFSSSRPVLRDEEQQLRGLDSALRDASMLRAEAAHSIESISREFERDFKIGNPDRSSASSLVVKACKLVSRMAVASSRLEFNAAAALNVSKIGAVERESIIAALQEGIAGTDVGVELVRQHMTQQLKEQRLVHEKAISQSEAALGLMQSEVALSEEAIEQIRQFAKDLGIQFEDERKANVAHLQSVTVKRLAKFALARGWTTWFEEYHHRQHVKQTTMARFRNSAIGAAFGKWVQCHPPMTRLRRQLEPYQARIDDLEDALRRERQDHADTRAMLEVKMNDGQAQAQRKIQTQEQLRVEHLMSIGIRRLLKGELARGWSQWYHLYEQKRKNQQRAMARFRNVGQWKAFRTWKRVCPPAPNVTAEQQKLIDDLEAELEAEKAGHATTRADRARSDAKWEQKLSDVYHRAAELRATVSELQSVIKDAYDAGTWSYCRQLLYHERLRYVPTAATHRRQSMPSGRPTSPQLRPSSQELERRVFVSLKKSPSSTWSSELRQPTRERDKRTWNL